MLLQTGGGGHHWTILAVPQDHAGTSRVVKQTTYTIGLAAAIGTDPNRIYAPASHGAAIAADDRFVLIENCRKRLTQTLQLINSRSAAEVAGDLDTPRLWLDLRHGNGGEAHDRQLPACLVEPELRIKWLRFDLGTGGKIVGGASGDVEHIFLRFQGQEPTARQPPRNTR